MVVRAREFIRARGEWCLLCATPVIHSHRSVALLLKSCGLLSAALLFFRLFDFQKNTQCFLVVIHKHITPHSRTTSHPTQKQTHCPPQHHHNHLQPSPTMCQVQPIPTTPLPTHLADSKIKKVRSHPLPLRPRRAPPHQALPLCAQRPGAHVFWIVVD